MTSSIVSPSFVDVDFERIIWNSLGEVRDIFVLPFTTQAVALS